MFSRLHGERLREEGLRVRAGAPARAVRRARLEPDPDAADPTAPLVVFAGRHIPEKRAPAGSGRGVRGPGAVPGLRGLILGDGPERPKVLDAIAAAGAHGVVEAPGFVAERGGRGALARALCLLLPSSREGYGLVVIEAAAAARRPSSSPARTTPRSSSSSTA